MRIALQTILWGRRIEGPSDIFRSIREMGCEGVEIAQPPKMLPDPKQLKGLFSALDLRFVGFAGGSLASRVKYCRRGEFWPEYFYVENCTDDTMRISEREGFTLALHPHAYTPVRRMDDVIALLEKYPALKFLPDTAHLTITHDDAASAIERYSERLAAVHLKDWTPKYGRSVHWYARGFTELGAGKVPILESLDVLRRSRFKGWLIVEQDCSSRDELEAAQVSLSWLSRHGIQSKPYAAPATIPQLTMSGGKRVISDRKMAPFYDALMHGMRAENTSSFCAKALEALCRLVSAKGATVWEHSPMKGLIGFLAGYPDECAPSDAFVLKTDQSTSATAITEQVIIRKNLRTEKQKPFHGSESLPNLRADSMISIPVLNSYNANYVELVIDLYTDNTAAVFTDCDLSKCSELIALTYESVLNDVCLSAAASASLDVAIVQSSHACLDVLKHQIQDTVECEGVSIFLPDLTDRRLEVRATTGIDWRVSADEEFYSRGDGHDTTWAWEHNEPFFTQYESERAHLTGKSYERVASMDQDVCLITPLRSGHGDECIGVIRCRNKRTGRNMFSESDISIIDAITQAITPTLQTLVQDERRAKTLSRVTHELKTPLNVIRGAAEFVEWEMKSNGYAFDYPYASDIIEWCELEYQLLGRADWFRFRLDDLEPKPTKTLLLRDVFGPVRHQIGPLLRERDFSARNILDDGFKEIRYIYVDRKMLQQVFFNLVANAVKYGFRDPSAFQVEVETAKDSRGFSIFFRDWGKGILEGWEEAIFREGVRSPEAIRGDVVGDGLGLWMVREIVQSHGGKVWASHCAQPTEFTIVLPFRLCRPDWNQR